jgi:hypothetical protein
VAATEGSNYRVVGLPVPEIRGVKVSRSQFLPRATGHTAKNTAMKFHGVVATVVDQVSEQPEVDITSGSGDTGCRKRDFRVFSCFRSFSRPIISEDRIQKSIKLHR